MQPMYTAHTAPWQIAYNAPKKRAEFQWLEDVVRLLLAHPDVDLPAAYDDDDDDDAAGADVDDGRGFSVLHLAGVPKYWDHKQARGALRVFEALVDAILDRGGSLDAQVSWSLPLSLPLLWG